MKEEITIDQKIKLMEIVLNFTNSDVLVETYKELLNAIIGDPEPKPENL